ncbi:MFS transporter [Blastococcus sp. SYSU D00669]
MRTTTSPSPRTAYLAFASYGALWGVWGAALPAVRDAAGVTQGQLGTALLFIGLGALPAMLLTGRAVDRFGGRAAAVTLVLMAVAGVAVATAAADVVSLAVLLLLLGAMSGSGDVGINAVAGAAERLTGRPVLTRAHGVFSTAVVAGALGTGGIQALGLPVAVAFGLVVLATLAAAVSLWPVRLATGVDVPAAGSPSARTPSWALPLVAVGLVGALAFAVENAHQSWGAVFLADELAVAGGLTAAAPAVFAGVAAAARFAAGASARVPAGALLTGGAVTATAGTLLLARSSSSVTALAGLALAAAGTAVLFPTLMRTALADVRDEVRGRATSAVSTTSYLGFVLGPVFVGALADAAGLRTAMLGVAALAVLTAVLARPVARWGSAAAGQRAGTSPREREATPVA